MGRNFAVGLVWLSTWAAIGFTPSIAQDDPGQICAFRCAPSAANASKNERCMSECIEEFERSQQKPIKSNAADLSALDGYWLKKSVPCGSPSDASWSIDATGASAFEASCTLQSLVRKGKVLTLKQRCEYFENEVEDQTVKIRIVSRKEIEIHGTRYRKCPRP